MTVFLTTVIPPVLSQISTVNTIAREIADPQQLVQQGKGYYDAGQFHLAAQFLSKAAEVFATQGNALKQAIALSNLSLTYQQLGELDLAEQVITKSLNLLGFNLQSLQSGKISEGSREQLRILAKTLDIQGRLWLVRGKPDVALNIWKLAANTYTKFGDDAGITGSLINQAQALQALGLYQDAKNTLEQVQQTLEQSPNSLLKAKGLRSLGDTLRAIGDLKNSQKVLQQSLNIVELLPSSQAKSEAKSAASLSLSNTVRLEGNIQRDRQDTNSNWNSLSWRCANRSIPDEAYQFYRQAEVGYQQVIEASTSPEMQVDAQLNHLSLLLETKQWPAAQTLWPQIYLDSLQNSRTAVYARINLAKSLACLQQQNTSINSPLWENINNLLLTAVQNAEDLKDERAKSYALGNQGGLYEYFGWLDRQYQRQSQAQKWINKAQQLTQEALLKAQPIQAPDIAYQWQWQMGRLLAAQGDTQKAIAAYQGAVETLESARSDLLTINTDIQFSFRDNVEPVYRELVDLLLKADGNSEQNQKNIEDAPKAIESLRLAEIQNFLRCNLGNSLSVEISKNQIDPTAAIIYPIILKDRLEVIFSIPGQPTRHYAAPDSGQKKVEEILKKLREELREPGGAGEVRDLSKQVYSWLIKPLEEELNRTNKIATLVFILDGYLQNIPMGVLYDDKDKKYLLQKYAIALTPGLQLLGPKPLQRKQLKLLTAGVSEERKFPDGLSFSKLPNVEEELKLIRSEVPTSEELLNQEFTKISLQNELNSDSFSVVHMATHGEFSSDPELTYILTYNGPLKGKELKDLLKTNSERRATTIELLVLSACQTAQSDRRAALGLAGIAVGAGARSTLAALWRVNDRSTADLMVQFYKELINHPELTKAKALQQAQLDLFARKSDPFYWAPYIMVGNWL